MNSIRSEFGFDKAPIKLIFNSASHPKGYKVSIPVINRLMSTLNRSSPMSLYIVAKIFIINIHVDRLLESMIRFIEIYE